ncbi:hypothetical protein COCCADRAFT_31542 [Bipolaris zeicola 26-R-13]|uniref:Uncharacterized protein n=1 Tax=Cochliobolus carbonum (strain 26-R-13) TaxID=930089 RepID=W6XVE8_COCC2|nr:uncharacterized protein COCCADRAFT_31542 [Bipolaris zeicola 26-R-13]EUC26754.1 hypothetical protein COCCADRAFT_31542 [Bipolaris zeicola 26-R-13]
MTFRITGCGAQGFTSWPVRYVGRRPGTCKIGATRHLRWFRVVSMDAVRRSRVKEGMFRRSWVHVGDVGGGEEWVQVVRSPKVQFESAIFYQTAAEHLLIAISGAR